MSVFVLRGLELALWFRSVVRNVRRTLLLLKLGTRLHVLQVMGLCVKEVTTQLTTNEVFFLEQSQLSNTHTDDKKNTLAPYTLNPSKFETLNPSTFLTLNLGN